MTQGSRNHPEDSEIPESRETTGPESRGTTGSRSQPELFRVPGVIRKIQGFPASPGIWFPRVTGEIRVPGDTRKCSGFQEVH